MKYARFSPTPVDLLPRANVCPHSEFFNINLHCMPPPKKKLYNIKKQKKLYNSWRPIYVRSSKVRKFSGTTSGSSQNGPGSTPGWTIVAQLETRWLTRRKNFDFGQWLNFRFGFECFPIVKRIALTIPGHKSQIGAFRINHSWADPFAKTLQSTMFCEGASLPL